MTDRDELADLIADTYDAHAPEGLECADNAADAILARWRLVPVGSDQELVLLHHQGLSDQQIAERFQQPTRTVAARRRKMGLGYNDSTGGN